MVFPAGLESAARRIQEIRQRLETIESRLSHPAFSNADPGLFNRILDETLNPMEKAPHEESSEPSAIEEIIEAQSRKTGLDPSLVKAVVKAESGFNPEAVSQAGAQGLMQLMPSTAQDLGVRSLLNPTENVAGGTRYLKSLLDKYHSVPQALAAYNAGPGAVDRYNGIPPYSETRNYVKQVLQYQRQYQQQDME